MGGAVSGVAGPNWMLIGDAAACVNPLNGEGIDYGLETGGWPPSCSAPATCRRRGRRATAALRPGVLGRAPAGAVADDPAVPAVDGPVAMRSASDEHRGAGDGQPRDRRGRRLGRAGVARRGCRVAADRPPAAVQLRASWRRGSTASPQRPFTDVASWRSAPPTPTTCGAARASGYRSHHQERGRSGPLARRPSRVDDVRRMRRPRRSSRTPAARRWRRSDPPSLAPSIVVTFWSVLTQLAGPAYPAEPISGDQCQ